MIGPKQESAGGSASWSQSYVTREQLGEYLHISSRKVSAMTAKGEIPAVKLGTGKNASIRYRLFAVDEALLKLRIN